MPRIFAYIVHKSGVADDTAAELPVAARKIDPAQPCTAIVTGWGADLDQVCESLRTSYSEIWKIAKEPLAYPNAELVRKALLTVLPAGSILLVPHAHFGVDLSPGLSIKMNAAYVPDVLDIEGVGWGVAQSRPPGIRGPGQHARPLQPFDRRGVEHPPRGVPAIRRHPRLAGRSWTDPRRSAP